MGELIHGWVGHTEDGAVGEVVSEEGVDLDQHFECFSDGEGDSSPFEVRLSVGGHAYFGEVEVVVVLFVAGLD